MADLKNSALAHLPSGNFWANSVWLVLATIAFNLTRAAGALAGAMHARATTGTLRTRPITVPARLARSGRALALHLPQRWPWATAWRKLFSAARHGPPAPQTTWPPRRRRHGTAPKWKSRSDRRTAHAITPTTAAAPHHPLQTKITGGSGLRRRRPPTTWPYDPIRMRRSGSRTLVGTDSGRSGRADHP